VPYTFFEVFRLLLDMKAVEQFSDRDWVTSNHLDRHLPLESILDG
jgi:hypothetical protein